MKKIIITAAALVALASCQETIITDREDGAISVNIDASAAVEVVTKGEDQLTADDFPVYMKKDDYVVKSFAKYSDITGPVTVPAGEYVVSCENISIADSFTSNENWGEVRYYGDSGVLAVKAGPDPTPCQFTCKMANTAVSIDFSDNIKYHFKDIKVYVSTESSRSLEYTTETTDKVGYYAPETMTYRFTGKYMDETEPMSITGTKALTAATHLHLTFTINEQTGTLDKPVITVEDECTDLNTTITVDPSENGSLTEENVTE